MEADKRTIHRYSPRSSWIQDQDQENFDVAELMGINQNAEKAKTDDQTRRKPRIEKKYLKFSTEIFER
jgi:hypothetical protein